MINNAVIKENSQLRREARAQLKGNWLMAILLCVVFSLVSSLPSIVPAIGFIVSFVIAGPLTLGLASCFLSLIRTNTFNFEDLFSGFNNFLPAFLVTLLTGIFVFLWSLLLFIPGIIASLRYSMAIYILHDNPEMSAMDAINASKVMMKGYKGKLFCMHLSFIGWGILSTLTFGIGFFWLIPYVYTSMANFYENLKEVQMFQN